LCSLCFTVTFTPVYSYVPFESNRKQLFPYTALIPLNVELNPICRLLSLLEAHHILHVSRVRVNPFGFYDRNKLCPLSRGDWVLIKCRLILGRLCLLFARTALGLFFLLLQNNVYCSEGTDLMRFREYY